jgi:ubiquinone/menaquinone biosynthesis C-methylase UbiE
VYAALYTVRACLRLADQIIEKQVIRSIEERLLKTEQTRGIAAEWWTVSARRFTATQNAEWWNRHDWTGLGEEWTPSEAWKSAILERFLIPYVPDARPALEIGPGGGRWTEVLQRRASSLAVLDIAERPLAICKQRFQSCDNISYLLGDGRTIPLPDQSVDSVWSYDVFVHISPVDARNYFADIARVLRPGAYAVIHHPGHDFDSARIRANRSDLTDNLVLSFAAENGLAVVEQTRELVNQGDVLTILKKEHAN